MIFAIGEGDLVAGASAGAGSEAVLSLRGQGRGHALRLSEGRKDLPIVT